MDLSNLKPAKGSINKNSKRVGRGQGSGKGGRITKTDIKSYLENSQNSEKVTLDESSGRDEERVPMSRMRSTIAKRLLTVSQETAMLTTFNEVDMTAVMDLRKKYKESFEQNHNVKLGFMGFFVKSVISALKIFPAVNGEIEGNERNISYE